MKSWLLYAQMKRNVCFTRSNMKRLKLITVIFFVILCLAALQIFQDWSSNIHRFVGISSTPSNSRKGTLRILQTTEQIKSKSSLTPLIKTRSTTKTAVVIKKSSTRLMPPATKSSTISITAFNKKSLPAIGTSNKKSTILNIVPHTKLKTMSKKNWNVYRQIILNNFKLFPIIKKEKVTRILLITYFRGGSTFLGDILQQNWKTFYHFEPLHLMSSNSRLDHNQSSEAFKLLSYLFRCNFSQTFRYNRWASFQKHMFLFKRNRFLWSTCNKYSVLCFNSQYLHNICTRSPVQVMKLTRLHLKDALLFLKENSDLNIKLIYLSRDPRAIISSRKVLDWCKKEKCNNPAILCKEMDNDFEELQKSNIPHQWIRYEDLSIDTENITRNLYKWLGIPFTYQVTSFLHSHTNAKLSDTKDPYSTRRNSSTAPFEWLHRLPYREINNIQIRCAGTMNKLGYKEIDNSTYFDYNGQKSLHLNKTALY
ncbi:carbohydrate sulfotransferase 4-like isoform X1 [Centruroides sculpturatus]|uniref:carbohydrate sulfotransferase 4-like isoform X1 n=2 Tax=Centruroides sculpturatus TaxID=218467 RepID=UPI000C6D3842|nr:carbohydrate sulfotransferase 4-like isoform X1 [Centruroides sculpturatus]